MAYLTDGFVPEWFVREKPKGMALANKLVAAGLWIAGTNGDESGWWFHDWKEECTKAYIEKVRKLARDRKRKSRENTRNEDGESQGESRVTEPVTDASRHANVWIQPNPTQPNPVISLVTSSEDVPSVGAHSAAAAEKRGGYIPEGWTPNDNTRQWARDNYGHLDLRHELAQFVSYWSGESGQRARKRDWNQAFRNWLGKRRAATSTAAPGAPVRPSKARIAHELAERMREQEQQQALALTPVNGKELA